MSDVVWEDPPAKRNGPPSKWFPLLEPLMAQPKRWARIANKVTPQAARQTTNNLQKGLLAKPPGKWEFATRTEDQRGVVYARYLGPDDKVVE